MLARVQRFAAGRSSSGHEAASRDAAEEAAGAASRRSCAAIGWAGVPRQPQRRHRASNRRRCHRCSGSTRRRTARHSSLRQVLSAVIPRCVSSDGTWRGGETTCNVAAASATARRHAVQCSAVQRSTHLRTTRCRRPAKACGRWAQGWPCYRSAGRASACAWRSRAKAPGTRGQADSGPLARRPAERAVRGNSECHFDRAASLGFEGLRARPHIHCSVRGVSNATHTLPR